MTMSLVVDQKEDLRLRMADLEKKLAESEEERCKLEKTCNILMRAFREEEKMQYNALNKRYEKFLEDCSARKRRNNIILRSLRRIEDRSRALFAKTERLKLLKDRYISYLNLNDYRKGDFHSGRSEKVIDDAALPKYVQWTTPLASHLKPDRVQEAVPGLLDRSRLSDSFSRDPITSDGSDDQFEGRKGSDTNSLNGISNAETSSFVYKLNPAETGHGPKGDTDERRIQSEKFGRNQIKPGNSISDGDKAEEKVIGTESIEIVKKGLAFEGEHFSRGNSYERLDPWIGKTTEKADVDQREVSITKPSPRIDYSWTCEDDEKYEEETINKETDQLHPERSETLPKGLDGVDYQNETYPESYYEQPVHHNHTSIASDVILEEDETEQEEEEKDFTPEHSFRETRPSPKGSSCEPLVGEPQWTTDETDKHMQEQDRGQAVGEEVRRRESDSEKSVEGKQSDRSERSEAEKSEKRKTGVKSNLIHLLESDSESFQIEHGDGISGNEDSDFDFSFHQN